MVKLNVVHALTKLRIIVEGITEEMFLVEGVPSVTSNRHQIRCIAKLAWRKCAKQPKSGEKESNMPQSETNVIEPDVRELPDVPSELIRHALEDLDKARQVENVIVDMGVWHSPQMYYEEHHEEVAICRMCFAGAVMRGSLGTFDESDVTPEDFPPSDTCKLNALDQIRKGNVVGFLNDVWEVPMGDVLVYSEAQEIGRKVEEATYQLAKDYGSNYFAWKQWMNAIADELERMGF